MQHQKCRICGERHPLGPCPMETRARVPAAIAAEQIKAERAFASIDPPTRRVLRERDAARMAATKYAPDGDCPYCDFQRERSAEAVRLHRQRKLTP